MRKILSNKSVQNTLTLAGVFVIWEVIAYVELVPKTLFPPPSQVASALLEMAKSGELVRDFWVSMRRALLGLAVGTLAGIAIGIITGRLPIADGLLTPCIQLARPLPPVAVLPLLITWLGITEFSKIFSIAFAVFFPVWMNSHLGAREIPKTYLWTAQSLGLGAGSTFLRVILPAALPFIAAGFRTGISMAFVMVFVSELAGASAGIGYQINLAHLAYRVDRMMAGLVTLAVAGALTDRIFTWLLRVTFPWLYLTQST
jgi:ABC-type nitrate/sulfonate/bicarbonate transport system permease component